MSILRWAILLLLFISIWACASQPGLKSSGSASRFALDVSFPNETGWSAIPSGVALQTGDRFSLRIQVKEPLYLYVQQRGSSGTVTSLYPPAEAIGAPAQPSGPVLLPASGFYTLAGPAGPETLIVIASTAALTAEQLQSELGRSDQAAGTAREPPPESTSRNRGIVFLGSLDGRGIGFVRFRLVHR